MKFNTKNIIIEIDDPTKPAFETVGITKSGARIIKANRAAAREAARKSAIKRREMKKANKTALLVDVA